MTWRLFAFTSLFSQMLRVPLVLFIISNISYLDDYFIIVATSIPAQFFATEILLYRGLSFGNKKESILGLSIIALWFFSLIYFVVNNNIMATLFYIIFSFSVVSYGYFTFQLREKLGAIEFLKYDAIVNFFITVSCVFIILYLPEKFSSYFIIAITSLVYFTFSTACFFYFRIQRTPFYKREVILGSNYRGYLSQILIMVTTQLERMIIGLIWPTFLAYISIVGAGTNAWRRLTLDDSILFSSLDGYDTNSIVLTAFSKYKKSAFYISCIGVISSFILLSNINIISKIINVDSDMISNLVFLSLVYLIVMPSGIVSINLIRSNKFLPRFASFSYLFLVIGLLLILLLYVSIFDVEQGFSWVVVLATSAINVVLFFDFLCCNRILKGNRSFQYFFSMFMLCVIFYYVN